LLHLTRELLPVALNTIPVHRKPPVASKRCGRPGDGRFREGWGSCSGNRRYTSFRHCRNLNFRRGRSAGPRRTLTCRKQISRALIWLAPTLVYSRGPSSV